MSLSNLSGTKSQVKQSEKTFLCMTVLRTHTRLASLKGSSPHGNRFLICRSSINGVPDGGMGKGGRKRDGRGRERGQYPKVEFFNTYTSPSMCSRFSVCTWSERSACHVILSCPCYVSSSVHVTSLIVLWGGVFHVVCKGLKT